MGQFIVDTSAFISLGTGDYLQEIVSRLECHTTETVRLELSEMAEREDNFACVAELILKEIEARSVSLHEVEFDPQAFHNCIDHGEASCVVLGNSMQARYLLTDEHNARHRIEDYFDNEVIHSPYIIGAFYRKGIITRREALTQFLKMTEKRHWMDSVLLAYGADIIFQDTEVSVTEVLKIVTNVSREKFGDKMKAMSESILRKVGLHEE
ncbi:MAG: hypothetical protein ABEK50_10470 [bacterium]